MAKGKILVVEDDPDVALATRLCLESAGYRVMEARNSAEGLEVIQQDRPDLIIMDVMMDSTTEGFQMALTLRSHDPKSEYRAFEDIPIIMQTSIHSTTPVRFAPDRDYLPVDRFMDKPLDPDKLLKVVAELLKKA
jgi:CheY-like chemotaxis protein